MAATPKKGPNARRPARANALAFALWENVRAPLLAAVFAVVLHLLESTPLRITSPTTVLLVWAVFATYNWRLRDGLAAAFVAVSFALFFYSEPGQFLHYSPERLRALTGSLIATLALMAVFTRSKNKIGEAIRAQQNARAQMSEILESITDAFVAADTNWAFTYLNAEAERLLGKTRAQLMGYNLLDVIPEAESTLFHWQYRRVLEQRVPVNFESQALQPDRRYEVHAYPTETGLAVYFRDVTEWHKAQEALRQSEERYRELFENANDLLYTHDLVGNFTSVNNACVNLTGYTHDELLHMNLSELVAPEDLDRARRMLLHKLQNGGGATTYEIALVAKDRRYVPVEVSTRLLMERGQPVGVQAIARDISERKRAETALRNMSLTDALTGVYNRRGAVTLADQQLKVAQRLGRTMLLLYADLNHLKTINDSLGHSSGDAALIETAQLLQTTFRESDIIARMGGDEFIVLAMESDTSDERTLRERLAERLAERNATSNRAYVLSISVGVARFDPEQPHDFDELVAEADRKMYGDKRRTRAGV